MRRRLIAAVLAGGILLTASVSPAAAYYATDVVPAVHCMSRYTIDTHYRGTNVATLTFFKGDPLANCTSLLIGMKWANTAGSPVYTQYQSIDTPDPLRNSYTVKLEANGVYCVAVMFKVYTKSFPVTTGWITC